MPILEIYLETALMNTSVQAMDTAWVASPGHQGSSLLTNEPTLLGVIIEVHPGMLLVQTDGDINVNGAPVDQGHFLLFSKATSVNESGLKGYYADVTFRNPSKERAELFAISSEAVISSK